MCACKRTDGHFTAAQSTCIIRVLIQHNFGKSTSVIRFDRSLLSLVKEWEFMCSDARERNTVIQIPWWCLRVGLFGCLLLKGQWDPVEQRDETKQDIGHSKQTSQRLSDIYRSNGFQYTRALALINSCRQTEQTLAPHHLQCSSPNHESAH